MGPRRRERRMKMLWVPVLEPAPVESALRLTLAVVVAVAAPGIGADSCLFAPMRLS